MNEKYSIKEPLGFFWKCGLTSDEIKLKLERKEIPDTWLVCELGQADQAVRLDRFDQLLAEVRERQEKNSVPDSTQHSPLNAQPTNDQTATIPNDNSKELESTIPLNWYWFFVLFLLPINIARSVMRMIAFPELWYVSLFDAAFQGTLAFGLLKRKQWAWFLVLIVPLLQVVFFSTAMGSRHNAVGGFLAALVAVCLWAVPNCVYFYRRKALFDIGHSAFDTRLPSFLRPYGLEVQPEDDGGAYAKAYQEATGEGRDTATWAKAFVEADGDEKRAQAAYIRHRVLELLKMGAVPSGSVEINPAPPTFLVRALYIVAFLLCLGVSAHNSFGNPNITIIAMCLGFFGAVFWYGCLEPS